MAHGHNAADVYPTYLKAFNAGDIDATLACYEPQACFVLKSGHVARGAAELREAYRATFSYKPDLKLDVRKIISAGDDIALAPSPLKCGAAFSARMTGIRSCSSPIALFGPHVKIVQLNTSSPLVGDFHFAHRPAITICASSTMAIACDCFSFPFASSFFHS